MVQWKLIRCERNRVGQLWVATLMEFENVPFEGTDRISTGRFDVRRLESRKTRWRQFALLAAGLAGLWLAHDIARWPRDSSAPRVGLWVTVVVAVSLFAMARATIGFVNSVEHGRARVFRWRHLLAAAMIEVTIAVMLTKGLLAGDSFGRLLSGGRITGQDIADLGHVIAVALCLVGAITALIAASDAFHDERRWRRSARVKR
jgi:hypothetical protein